MSIAQQLQGVIQELPERVRLIAVSKTHSNEKILEAYQAGQRNFGENKVQEMTEKQETLPKDINWHMIGNLQTNKVKYIAPYVSLIHSVDRMKLLREINKRAAEHNRIIDCLLQIHIAEEENKIGFSKEELSNLLKEGALDEFKNVRVTGLMGMATFTENVTQITEEFRNLKRYFDQIKEDYYPKEPSFNTLSMGMSSDYAIAVKEGSNMIRVGSLIFGERNYN